MDYLFFIAIIPITVIVLVIILVFILLNRDKSKNSQQSNISTNGHTSYNRSNEKSQIEQLLDLKSYMMQIY